MFSRLTHLSNSISRVIVPNRNFSQRLIKLNELSNIEGSVKKVSNYRIVSYRVLIILDFSFLSLSISVFVSYGCRESVGVVVLDQVVARHLVMVINSHVLHHVVLKVDKHLYTSAFLRLVFTILSKTDISFLGFGHMC